MKPVQMTDAERLARIETILEMQEREMRQYGRKSDQVMMTLLEKLDLLDAKIEVRFKDIENRAFDDAQELQALKNKGAGVLAAIGVVFTATATIFSEMFSAIKHAIFG